MDASKYGQGHFTRLTEAECHHLLRTNTVGRISWVTREGLVILPVVYAVHDGVIVFRTSSEGILADLTGGRDAAFQIDQVDEETKTGWSVLVSGITRTPQDPRELVRLWSHDTPVPWADGERNLFICVAPQKVTGRAVSSYE